MFTSYKRHYFLDTPSTKGSAARQAHARTGRPDIDDTIGKKNATLSSHTDSAQPRKRTLDTRPSFVRESREGLRPRLPSQAHVTKTFTRSPHMDARRSTSWNCDRHRCVRNFNGPRKRCSASYSVNNLRERSRHSIKENFALWIRSTRQQDGKQTFFPRCCARSRCCEQVQGYKTLHGDCKFAVWCCIILLPLCRQHTRITTCSLQERVWKEYLKSHSLPT